jgi:Fe-S cluster biosynthesis and repair protein YggX
MARTVFCAKLKRELPGLDKPPFPGQLGQRIYEHISQQAWSMWPGQERILMNHYGLNMADPNARKLLMDQMEEFFFGETPEMPEGWTPPAPGGKGGAAPSKGGAAPRRK